MGLAFFVCFFFFSFEKKQRKAKKDFLKIIFFFKDVYLAEFLHERAFPSGGSRQNCSLFLSFFLIFS